GDVPTQAVWLRLEGLESYDLLKLRIVSSASAQRQFELTSLAIGAALALLGIAALFNFGLAIGLRRRFFLWHGGWSAAVMLWGVVWSQIGLLVLPGIAGTITSRLATGLACFSILLAALATASALRGILEKAALRLLVGLGWAMFAMGVASGLPGADITFFAPLLGIGTLMSVAVAVICIATAWRKGHVEGRDLAISWALPMATLVLTLVVDLGGVLWGGGDKIVMLFASALQVVCLTAFATTRLGALRVERDTAIATGKRLAELAERDPLTGLLNRRGFLARCAKDFGGRTTVPFGLILIDVDRFKAVNDEFGHQAGDEALILLADKLKTFEAAHDCHAG
ncbi:MAG: diguanylate cyclase, partial [Pseudomonadota bacterium]|nr:diguanylate cyclase [Pseudomonadota bacterium]